MVGGGGGDGFEFKVSAASQVLPSQLALKQRSGTGPPDHATSPAGEQGFRV